MEKKKPGRPKLDTTRVMRCIRVLEEDWDQWSAVAEANGKTVSEWIRETMNRAAKRKGKQ